MFPISLVSFLLVMYERIQRHPTELKTKIEKADVETVGLLLFFYRSKQLLMDHKNTIRLVL